MKKFSRLASWWATDSDIQSGCQAYRQELKRSDRENAPSDQAVAVKRTCVRGPAFANATPVRDHARL
jgi:hypothetical protein